METAHISDEDLERYFLDMVTEEQELAAIEEHLLWCEICQERAEATQDFIDAMRDAGDGLP